MGAARAMLTARIVSGAGSLTIKAAGLERGGAIFSPRPRQRACQVPSTREGGDALRACLDLGPGPLGTKANMSHVACKWVPEAINKKVT